MIDFSRYRLKNGLNVLVHEDRSSPLVAMNILYMVGSRDEDPGRTGLAHLFEHLMFGGSVNIPEYDLPLQLAGGDNNAFTNNDITNYYITVPSENIETAFWLESDRMLELDFSQKNLDIQRSVVIQEFKQRYLNQPYGDAMLNLRPLAYTTHPYRWPTIGMDISHIQSAGLEEVKEFFFGHYAPNNAILTLTGSITPEKGFDLTEKWFGEIPARNIKSSIYPAEPDQKTERILTLERDVPSDALYKAWHTCGRGSREFHSLDLITDLLSGGESGRLYTNLVRNQNIFSEINAYLTSETDPGLMVLFGRLMKDIDIRTADAAVNDIIDGLKDGKVENREIEKVKNKFESSTVLANTSILNKAIGISFYEMLGDADLINREVENYRAVGESDITKTSLKYLTRENCSTIYYLSSRNNQK